MHRKNTYSTRQSRIESDKSSMDKSTLELLPNELLLSIFSYLSSFDLCQAFLNMNNARIEHLLTSMRHTLDVSAMKRGQWCRFLNNINQDSTKRFISLVDTIVLHDSPGCVALFDRLKEATNDVSQSYPMLSSTKKLLVLNADYWFGLGEILSSSLVFHNSTFRHLHLVFEKSSYMYLSTLSQLVTRHVSVHTMLLEVEKSIGRYDRDWMDKPDILKSLCWPNTVQLTLSIQYSSELLLLFQRDALPRIEHLEVTIELTCWTLPLQHDQTITGIPIDGDQLRETVDGTRLRFLLLRFMTLADFIKLMDILELPSLEELVLIDLSDRTLDHLGKFQEFCHPAHLPSLQHLHFSLCFPKELEHTWRSSSFVCDKRWPFENVDCFIDQNRISIYDDLKTTFIVFTRPINVILQHKRIFHNHYWATHVSAPNQTTRRRSIQWICDETDRSDQFLQTLQVIAGDHVDKLDVHWREKRIDRTIIFDEKVLLSSNIQNQTDTSMVSKYFGKHNLFLQHLRSLKFYFYPGSIEKSQRISIVKQILDISPHLSRLHVDWNDFRHCSQTYSNLKYLHLVLVRLRIEPKQHIDICRLTQLAPRLCSLETSRSNMTFNENLLTFVLKIICNFNQLVHLTLNKYSLYRSKVEEKMMFKEKLLAAGHNHVFDSTNIRIEFGLYDDIYIWL